MCLSEFASNLRFTLVFNQFHDNSRSLEVKVSYPAAVLSPTGHEYRRPAGGQFFYALVQIVDSKTQVLNSFSFGLEIFPVGRFPF
jgi:hypothetical protein